jgi:hypothetical protein
MEVGGMGPRRVIPRDLEVLNQERLYNLRDIERHNAAPLERTHHTWREWCRSGVKNKSGDLVQLESTDVSGITHTSIEACRRFVAAMNAKTVDCLALGGCLDRCTVRLSDHVKRLTSGQALIDLEIKPFPGGVLPGDQIYFKLPYVDKHGNLVSLLIYERLPEIEQRIAEAIK